MAGVRTLRLSLAFLAAVLLAAGGAQADFDLDKICSFTTYIENCKSFIPKLAQKTPDALTEAVIKAGVAAAEEAVDFATKILSDPQTTGALKKHMETCLATYKETASSLSKADQILKQGKAGHEEMMSAISQAMAATSACEDAFDETLDVVSPVTDITNNIQMYIANGLALGMGVQNY